MKLALILNKFRFPKKNLKMLIVCQHASLLLQPIMQLFHNFKIGK